MEIRRSLLIQVAIDFGLCLLIGIPYLAVYLTVTPFKRGFFCNDESIMYPYHEDTVSMGACAGGGIAVAIVSFIIVEFALRGRGFKSLYKEVIWEIIKVSLAFLVGSGLVMVNIEIGKLTVGRPRPHFMAVCRPDFSKINCSQGYIEDFTCQNLGGYSERTLEEARKSFPSGHSAFSAYAALFLAVYFYQRLKWVGFSVLLSITAQLLVTMGAIYIMLSRISDYKHHWSDVLVGGFVGFLGAVWTVLCLGKRIGFFQPKQRKTVCEFENKQLEVQNVLNRMSTQEDVEAQNSIQNTGRQTFHAD